MKILPVLCTVIVCAFICAVIAWVASAQGDARESRTVQTAQGPVRGYKKDEIFEFLGIPYAKAPTGKDKFKPPLPGPIWKQPFEAINAKIVCPQFKYPIFNLSTYSMQEDCLVANVYIPETEKKNLSVLVYVHGGGFQLGWGEMKLPHKLVETKKIIAITFNYRLGAHGFLCLGTEGAPGNAGMKDQVALLRWVNKNIANFGGNPDDVTLAGSSAGSAAVDLLMLSEMTQGLFHKAIPESGAGVGLWSIQNDPVQIAKEFASERFFSDIHNMTALEEFYENAPFSDIMLHELDNEEDSSICFVPCVERNIGQETFLEESPVNILKRGKYKKVPVLYGFANMEGLMIVHKFSQWKDEMNYNFSNFLPVDLQFNSNEERDTVAKTIKEFYFGDKLVGEETVQGYIDYFSDIKITYPHLRSTQLQVAAGSDSIYLYMYSFYSPLPPVDGLPALPELMANVSGAGHTAQAAAVYDANFVTNIDKSEEYSKVREKMREIWLNFITTGKPVPEGSKLPAWPPVGPNRSPHIDLGAEMKLKGPLLEKRARFWDDIYERYYRMPVPPSSYMLLPPN